MPYVKEPYEAKVAVARLKATFYGLPASKAFIEAKGRASKPAIAAQVAMRNLYSHPALKRRRNLDCHVSCVIEHETIIRHRSVFVPDDEATDSLLNL